MKLIYGEEFEVGGETFLVTARALKFEYSFAVRLSSRSLSPNRKAAETSTPWVRKKTNNGTTNGLCSCFGLILEENFRFSIVYVAILEIFHIIFQFSIIYGWETLKSSVDPRRLFELETKSRRSRILSLYYLSRDTVGHECKYAVALTITCNSPLS